MKRWGLWIVPLERVLQSLPHLKLTTGQHSCLKKAKRCGAAGFSKRLPLTGTYFAQIGEQRRTAECRMVGLQGSMKAFTPFTVMRLRAESQNEVTRTERKNCKRNTRRSLPLDGQRFGAEFQAKFADNGHNRRHWIPFMTLLVAARVRRIHR